MESENSNEAFIRLVLALKQLALADLLLPTEGVIFAYSALDNSLSALVLLRGEQPPKEHGKKIGRFRYLYPAAKERLKCAPRLDKYLKKWKEVRYEGAESSVAEFSEIVRSAHELFDCAIVELGGEIKQDPSEVLEALRRKAAQERLETWREEIGEDQENLFTHLQTSVEGGAGFTAAATHLSNFINLNIETDTPALRDLLQKHPKVSEAVVELYKKFLALVEDTHMWNFSRLGDEAGFTHEAVKAGHRPSDSELTKLMSAGADFRLVVLLSYRGRNLIEHMNHIWASLAEARKKFVEEERDKHKSKEQ